MRASDSVHAGGATTRDRQRSRSTPRIAGRLLRRVRDFAVVEGVTREVADRSLQLLDVDAVCEQIRERGVPVRARKGYVTHKLVYSGFSCDRQFELYVEESYDHLFKFVKRQIQQGNMLSVPILPIYLRVLLYRVRILKSSYMWYSPVHLVEAGNVVGLINDLKQIQKAFLRQTI